MKSFYVSLLAIIGVIITLALCFITNNSWWLVLTVILFALGLNIKSLRRIIRIKKAAKTPMVTAKKEEPKEPDFKRIIREYEPNMSLVDTPEKAMENFYRCLALFKSLCRTKMSGLDKMSLEEVLEYRDKSVPSIEATYGNTDVSPYGIRARLHIPCMDETHCGEYAFLKDHIPVLTTGDHLVEEKDIFDYFVSKFIEEGVVLRFNL